MAVNRSTVANWVTGDNEILANTGAVRIKVIEIQGNPVQSQKAYVRIWNSITAIPGTTEPDFVIPVLIPNTDDGNIRQKVILPRGTRFPVGLSYGLYTTPHSSNVAPTINQGPMSVQIFYEPA